MKNKNLLICLIFVCILFSTIPNTFSQFWRHKKDTEQSIKYYGTLKGKITDIETKEGIPFGYVAIALVVKDKLYASSQTDIDGNYLFKSIPQGKYYLKVGYVGYCEVLLKDIQIKKDSTTIQNVQLKSSCKKLEKPAIYLYPKITQEIKVKLDFKGKIGNTYPEYKDRWTVKAEPDGKLLNKDDKRNYSYLFWDGIYNFLKTHYDYKTGFIVKRTEVVDFLQNKLSLMGLNNTEINDFIVYWLPLLNKNETNLIHFWVNDNIDNSAVMNIEPKPDTEIVVFMEFKKADNKQTIPEQILPKTERKGFTVVEWGGSEIGGEKIE